MEEARAAPLPPTPPADAMLAFMQSMMNMQAVQQQAMQMQQQQAMAAAAAAAEAAAASQAAQMVKMVELLAASQKSHHSNVKLEVKNFTRIDKFSNRREDWRQWRKYFIAAIRECDVDFATFLETADRQDVESLGMNPS